MLEMPEQLDNLPRKSDKREWNPSERKKYDVINKAERSWRSEEHFDIVMEKQSLEFSHLVVGLAFLNISSLCSPPYILKCDHYMLELRFYRGLQ